jgi:hypothetical protein
MASQTDRSKDHNDRSNMAILQWISSLNYKENMGGLLKKKASRNRRLGPWITGVEGLDIRKRQKLYPLFLRGVWNQKVDHGICNHGTTRARSDQTRWSSGVYFHHLRRRFLRIGHSSVDLQATRGTMLANSMADSQNLLSDGSSWKTELLSLWRLCNVQL